MHQTWRAAGFLALWIVLAPSAHADGASFLPRVYAEPGAIKDRQLTGSTAVPDRVDPFSGALSLSHVDLVLPGNGGLDIKIERHYSSNIWFNRSNPLLSAAYDQPSILLPPKPTGAGWTIGFGRVILAANRGTNVCEKWGNVIGGIGSVSTQWNAVLETPDGGLQALMLSSSGIADYITKNLWIANCYGNNEGLTVHSPDGLKYTMNHKVYVADEMNYTGSPVNVWYPTSIEDAKGNYLTINYTGGRTGSYAHINGITSSDGRVVQFGYTGDVLTSISTGNRIWNYEYQPASDLLGTGRKLLTRVTRPDGTQWLYGYNPAGMSAPGALNSVTAPYGGSVAYTYGLVDFDGSIAALAGQDKYPSVAVKTRIVKGFGGVDIGADAGTWTYTYQPGTDTTLEAGRLNDVTIVDSPVGQETYRHYGMQRFNTETGFSADRIWSIGLLGAKTIATGGNVIQTDIYNWQVQTDNNGSTLVLSEQIDNPVAYGIQQQWVLYPVLQSKSINRDGATYSTNTVTELATHGLSLLSKPGRIPVPRT